MLKEPLSPTGRKSSRPNIQSVGPNTQDAKVLRGILAKMFKDSLKQENGKRKTTSP